MRLKPQCASHCGWVYSGVPPPSGFIPATVQLAMVPAAERDGELVADLAAERARLGKSQMVSVRGLSAANQARVLGDRPDVLPVADPTSLRQGQQALVDKFYPPPRPGFVALVRAAPLAGALVPSRQHEEGRKRPKPCLKGFPPHAGHPVLAVCSSLRGTDGPRRPPRPDCGGR